MALPDELWVVEDRSEVYGFRAFAIYRNAVAFGQDPRRYVHEQPWYPASELPDNDREVMVVYRGERRIGYYNQNRAEWWVNGCGTRHITHWRELPPGPEDA